MSMSGEQTSVSEAKESIADADNIQIPKYYFMYSEKFTLCMSPVSLNALWNANDARRV